jgi:sugar O-acyltransferase (sialic acid O-acetyltransferase NeuD family)
MAAARPLVIVGAGGFGREVADVVDAINGAAVRPAWDFLGFVDEGSPRVDLLDRRGDVLLGGLDSLGDRADVSFVVAVAGAAARRHLVDAGTARGWLATVLVHPTAVLGRDVHIGEGTILCAHTNVTTHVMVGRHVHLDRGVNVGHDAVLGDRVTVHPGATISGAVALDDDVTVGSNAVVIQGLRVGVGATVGAGAAVVRDVAPGTTVVGVPARVLRTS